MGKTPGLPITILERDALVELDGRLYIVESRWFSFGAPVVKLVCLDSGLDEYFHGGVFGPPDPPLPTVTRRGNGKIGYLATREAAARLGT